MTRGRLCGMSLPRVRRRLPWRPVHETPGLLVRSDLAVRLSSVRTPAAGARRLVGRSELSADPVRRPAPALGPEGAGRDRTETRLDFPPCALARASARHCDRHARAAPVQPARAVALAGRVRARWRHAES